MRVVKVIRNDNDGYGWFEYDWEPADDDFWNIGDMWIMWGTTEFIVVDVWDY